MSLKHRELFTLLILFTLATSALLPLRVAAETNVTVSFTTTNATPLNIGFAGFTTELLGTGIEYADTNMQRLAGILSPGWLLYPAGRPVTHSIGPLA